MRDPEATSNSASDTLVLLHGVSGSAGMWHRVAPVLERTHRVLAPTALGHRGGRSPTKLPVRISDVVDDMERCLDENGLERAHLAGNSMGGWVALELARRGRARSVCALSPAGMWSHDVTRRLRSRRKLRWVALQAWMGRPFLPLLAHSAEFRRWSLRENARHGQRVSPRELLHLADDLLGCVVLQDLLRTSESLAPLDETRIPITVAWSEHDRVFPPELYLPAARNLVPHARFLTLADVGHVPMLDDPALVAQTILQSLQHAG